jgi:flagellar biosynthesis/type III secretory pathway chaperone
MPNEAPGKQAMTHSLKQFIGILDQTQTLYHDLLSIIEQEHDLVIHSKVEQLSALQVEKQSVLAQLAHLEKLRCQQLKQIAENLQLPLRQLNLSQLADHVPAPFGKQIHERRMALGKLVAATAKANEESRSLMKHCLNLVQGSLRFLQHWINPSSVYGASGNMNGKHKSGRLLSGTV